MAVLANSLATIAAATTGLCEILTAEVEEKNDEEEYIKRRMPIGEIILTMQEDIVRIKEIMQKDVEKTHSLAPDDIPGYGEDE